MSCFQEIASVYVWVHNICGGYRFDVIEKLVKGKVVALDAESKVKIKMFGEISWLFSDFKIKQRLLHLLVTASSIFGGM